MKKLQSISVILFAICIVNGFLFFASQVLGYFDSGVKVTSNQQIFSISMIVMATILPLFGAIVVRRLLGIFLSFSKASKAFLVLSAILLTGSTITPILGTTGTGLAEILVLELMHFTTAFAAIYAAETSVQKQWK